MKKLNTIITVCFVITFASVGYFTHTPEYIKISSPVPAIEEQKNHFKLPLPGGIIGEEKSGGGIKSLPAPPPPKHAPAPEHTAMIKDDSLLKNEYTRTVILGVIGWVVKNICALLLGLLKKLSFIKSLGW